jgi:ankyrin repeat protein
MRSRLDELQHAIKHGDVIAARKYVASGGDVRAGDDRHYAPLTMAARAGNTALIQLFLAAGADVNEGWPERTPLLLAAISGSAKAVALLLARGAKTDARGTPLPELLREYGYGSRERILGLIERARAGSGLTCA